MKRKPHLLLAGVLGGTVLLTSSNLSVGQDAAVPAQRVVEGGRRGEAPEANASAGATQGEAPNLPQILRGIVREIQQGKLKQAYDQIESFADDKSIPSGFRTSLKMQLLIALRQGAKDPELDGVEVAKKYLEDSIEDALSNPESIRDESIGMVQPFAEILSMLISSEENSDAALEYIAGLKERVLAAETTSSELNKQAIASTLTLATLIPNAKLKGVEDASKIMDQEIAKLQALLQEPNASAVRLILQNYLTTRMSSASDEQRTAILKQLLELADTALVNSPKALDIYSYGQIYLRLVVSKTTESPVEAKELLDNALAKLEAFASSDDAELKSAATTYRMRLSQMRSRIEARLKQQELIGKQAPAFDAEHWVNGEAVTLEQLQGKVVLVDFWAVWCGPCIASFPELIKWDEEYSDKGLVIIGVTSPYGFVWDDEAKQPTRPDSDEKVAIEDELSMLEKFIASHELTHRTMVTPKSSSMSVDYGVTGIPHVALIDQDGRVALIQVGSGGASAKRIESKIKELLKIE